MLLSRLHFRVLWMGGQKRWPFVSFAGLNFHTNLQMLQIVKNPSKLELDFREGKKCDRGVKGSKMLFWDKIVS